MSAGRFELGQMVATPGALAALEESGEQPSEFLARHAAGDWGALTDEDRKENEFSLAHGFRLLSSYRLRSGAKIWIITEADRSSTTVLLPGEY
jgi:hypothetical protein